jgi:hypothetical protein
MNLFQEESEPREKKNDKKTKGKNKTNMKGEQLNTLWEYTGDVRSSVTQTSQQQIFDATNILGSNASTTHFTGAVSTTDNAKESCKPELITQV